MTAPIQEPSTDRALQGMAYARDQIFRRPAPIGASASYEAGLAFDSGVSGTTSVNDNSLSLIAFDEVFVSTGATAIAIDDGSAGTTSPLKLLLDGWYFQSLCFEWTNPHTDVRHYQFKPDSPPDTNVETGNCISFTGSSPFSSGFNCTALNYYSTTGTNGQSLQVWQNSGSSKAVTAVMMWIVYLGPDLDPAGYPPF